MSLISCVYQSSPELAAPGNPNGYYENFRDAPEQTFADALKNTLAMGCVGTLLWDWGGASGVYYAGTPWLTDRPEAFYDQHVRRPWRDAGLRLGGTVRPQRIYRGRWEFPSPDDVYGTLAEKVDYGRNRLDWTIFYVDVNWLSGDDNTPRNLIPGDVFARLAAEYPDCLFFPEGARKDYEGIPGVRPLQYFPRPAQNASPSLLKVEGYVRDAQGELVPYKPTAAEFKELAACFKRGAWGLVSATSLNWPANTLIVKAQGK